jgi:hypothetical protein
MRFALTGTMVGLLAAATVGCGDSRGPVAARAPKPVVATVTLKVPGMT